ncbi:MAG: copper resistance protein CopC [Gemmatimonadaceae bacterium]
MTLPVSAISLSFIAMVMATPVYPSPATLATPAAPSASLAPFHLRLLKSQPAKDSSVAAPKVIKLWYSEPVTAPVSSITLEAAGGATVPVSKARSEESDPTLLMADVTGSLTPGTYVVRWRAASRDGHPVRGDFSFTVTK